MLRWLQSTVQTSGGIRLLARNKSSLSPNERPASSRRVNVSANASFKVQQQDKSLVTLSCSLKKLAPETVATLYESLRARSQHSSFSPRQLSALISVFGTSSLPSSAPRITNAHIEDSQRSSGSFWKYVFRVAKDKEKLGYSLNRGDHYWLMWAWIAKFHASERDNRVGFLSNASFHYHRIWKQTRFPDILAPYFEALLASGDPECLDMAVADLCSMLALHSNLHRRSLRLIWNVFLSNPENLTLSSRNKFLLSLRNRFRITHSSVRPSHYLATHMYNDLTKRHERLPVDLSQLVASLGAPLFSFFQLPVPISVQQWGRRQLQNILSPSVPIEIRWANFSLFALHQAARDNAAVGHTLNFDHVSFEPHFSDWHVVLTLSILETMVPGIAPSSDPSEVRSIMRGLLGKWERIGASDRPIFVSRAIVGSFLRLAARTRDLDILERCSRCIVDFALSKLDPKYTAADRIQVEALMGDYVEASIQCHGKIWTDTLQFFGMQQAATAAGSPSSLVQHHAEVIIQQLLPRDVQLAHEFYEFCLSDNIPIRQNVTTWLAVALAPTRVHVVYPMLERVLELAPLEKVLLVVLESLRAERYPYLAPVSARSLGQALIRFLQAKAPPPFMKYPLRYPLMTLIASGRALDVVRIAELMNKRVPSFLNDRFLHRLLASLLRHRQYRLAARLRHISKTRSDLSEERFRQKLFLGLHKGGAVTLARRFLNPRPSIRSSLSLHEVMLRRVFHGTAAFDRRSSSQLLSILCRKPDDIPSIKLAFSILLRSKRSAAAKGLLRRSLRYLDTSAKTWLGNLFLHRIIRRSSTRNVHVVRKIFRAKTYLVETFGFIPDRVTFNIFVKALLHWKSVDPSKTRLLFDNCIRLGYPAGSHWRRLNDVPFGTRSSLTSSSSTPFGMSALKPEISFKRHVKPLYKMFIKAFYVRKDVMAAKTVVGILKNEEAEDLARQQCRSRTRVERLRTASSVNKSE
ncbi:hypothetical protein GYMLUDRAFT_41836 [Collybiopsis luxurians FD-317 M1]|uniref:Uncharacterized protein n=1 Tax=Collybiopsis luxurians FD-317 M1 TaxID=944289 RepID=A0A0D0CSQ8_9AGAR|nr:hypothetical protein GYMLUDRAFT_41836 [Collybiopsis luxurians FD-317 M1]